VFAVPRLRKIISREEPDDFILVLPAHDAGIDVLLLADAERTPCGSNPAHRPRPRELLIIHDPERIAEARNLNPTSIERVKPGRSTRLCRECQVPDFADLSLASSLWLFSLLDS
jgi:hypothetical protein